MQKSYKTKQTTNNDSSFLDEFEIRKHQVLSIDAKNNKFSKKQFDALNNELHSKIIDEICYDGGARSGKTYLIVRNIIDRCLMSPGSRHLLARYRLNHLRMTLWKQTLLPALKDAGLKRNKDYWINESDHIVKFYNGAEIYASGLDDSDRVEKIMGSEFNTIFINEATQITYKTFQKLVTRLSFRRKEIKNKFFIDCNPRNRFHWIYKYFVLKQDPETEEALAESRVSRMCRRNWSPLDNPFLDKEYVQRLSELTGVERQRLYEGLWVDVEGLVYPMFESVIVEPFKIPKTWDSAGTVDFGYTNPFFFGWLYYDKSNETWYLTDEIHQVEKTVRLHSIEIKKRRKLPNLFIVADHDAEDRATMAEAGIQTIKADKDIATGIQALIKLMTAVKGQKLRIFRTCVKTIEEFSVYSWQPAKDNQNAKEEPIKNMDHAMDALRYFANKVIGNKRSVITRKKENIPDLTKKEKEKQTLDDIRKSRFKRMGIE